MIRLKDLPWVGKEAVRMDRIREIEMSGESSHVGVRPGKNA